MSTLTARRDLQKKKLVKSGWLALALGLIVPFFAIGAALVGLEVSRSGDRTMGRVLIVAGLTIFTLRFALYVG
jgi:hypothetical protein